MDVHKTKLTDHDHHFEQAIVESGGRPLILALDTQSQPREWISWKKAVEYYAKDLIVWQNSNDNDMMFFGGTSRMTGDRTIVITSSIITVKGIEDAKIRRRNGMNKHPLDNRALFRRDHHVCAYCGSEFHESELTRDHVHPRSRGGKDIWTNVVTACRRCNHSKGDQDAGVGGKFELLYVPYEPSKFEYLILQNRKVLADQMSFLQNGIKDPRSRWKIAA